LSALAENREIERLARPKPDHVRRVIGKIISSVGVGENGQAVPIKYSPCCKLPKALPGNGELAASTWVRPDGALMEVPDCHAEQGVRLASKRLSGSQFVGIKIDVCVEVSKIMHAAKIVCSARSSRAEAGIATAVCFPYHRSHRGSVAVASKRHIGSCERPLCRRLPISQTYVANVRYSNTVDQNRTDGIRPSIGHCRFWIIRLPLPMDRAILRGAGDPRPDWVQRIAWLAPSSAATFIIPIAACFDAQ